MTDYSKACVYKIVCKDASITDMYIGSTVNFKNRIFDHKGVCNNPNGKAYNRKVYKCIRDNGGWDNWEMKKICDVKCLDVYELREAEGSYQRELKPTLNQCIAGRSAQESQRAYYINNKDKRKVYILANKDKINKNRAARRAKNKDKISKSNKAYRLKNKAKIKAYQEAYRAKKKATQASSQV